MLRSSSSSCSHSHSKGRSLPYREQRGLRRLTSVGWPNLLALISGLVVTRPAPAKAGTAPAAEPAGADPRRALLEAYAAPPVELPESAWKLDLIVRGDLRRGEMLFGDAMAKGDPMDSAGAGLELRVYHPDADRYIAVRGRMRGVSGPLVIDPASHVEASQSSPENRGEADGHTLEGGLDIGWLLDPPPALHRVSSRLGLGLWGMTRRIDPTPMRSAPLNDRWLGPIGAARINYAIPPWCFLFAEGWFAPVVLHATSGGDDRDWGGHAGELSVGLTVEPLERLSLDLGYGWTHAESSAAGSGRSTENAGGPFLQLTLLW